MAPARSIASVPVSADMLPLKMTVDTDPTDGMPRLVAATLECIPWDYLAALRDIATLVLHRFDLGRSTLPPTSARFVSLMLLNVGGAFPADDPVLADERVNVVAVLWNANTMGAAHNAAFLECLARNHKAWSTSTLRLNLVGFPSDQEASMVALLNRPTKLRVTKLIVSLSCPRPKLAAAVRRFARAAATACVDLRDSHGSSVFDAPFVGL